MVITDLACQTFLVPTASEAERFAKYMTPTTVAAGCYKRVAVHVPPRSFVPLKPLLLTIPLKPT
jgi:hypothetical protein